MIILKRTDQDYVVILYFFIRSVVRMKLEISKKKNMIMEMQLYKISGEASLAEAGIRVRTQI